jgi:hypothetical protein
MLIKRTFIKQPIKSLFCALVNRLSRWRSSGARQPGKPTADCVRTDLPDSGIYRQSWRPWESNRFAAEVVNKKRSSCSKNIVFNFVGVSAGTFHDHIHFLSALRSSLGPSFRALYQPNTQNNQQFIKLHVSLCVWSFCYFRNIIALLK